MSRNSNVATWAVVLGSVLSNTSIAAQFVVDPAGNDSAAGTVGAPWKTLQHAADVVGPGAFVTVHAGNYAGFQLETSGTAAAPIEFFAQPGVHVTQAIPVRGDGINLEGASYVVIDGFNVAGMPHAGVRSVGAPDDLASHVTIRNVTASGNGKWGIFTGHVNDLLIENNHTSGSLDEHGIYVSNSGDRPVIRNNVIWGNNGSGIHMNGDISQGGDGIISGALVSGNIIYDNGFNGSGINMDGVQDSRIENNLVYENHSSGISLYQIDAGEPAKNNIVVNNTIHVADDGRWDLNIQDGSTGNTVRNNIFVTEHATHGAIDISADSLTGFTSDYNVVNPPFTKGGPFLSLANWRTQTGQELHSIAAEPSDLFVDWQNGNYQLLATAVARNAGTSQFAPAVDIAGKSRPIGGAYDIGAYEFGVAALTGDYNHDNTVNAADYSIWRDTLGSTTSLNADGDGSGKVDAGDFTVWKNSFAAGSGGGGVLSAVAEPTTAILSVLAMAAFATARSVTASRRVC